MIESSRAPQVYLDACKYDWATQFNKFIYPIRHWLYLMKLLRQRQLRFRGLDIYLNRPDQVVLEDEILLFLASYAHISRVLFVGCDWYTKSYHKLFSQQEYWTIEPDPNRAHYGAPNHIVDSLENLPRHFSENYFDLIVCGGALGYGLNTMTAANQAIGGCFHCLNPHGILIMGGHNVASAGSGLFSHLSDCEALERFIPYIFPAMSTSHCVIDTPTRHTFNFYQKPATTQPSTFNTLHLELSQLQV